MTVGRKPKPLQLRIIEGNPGHRPLQKNQPKPTPVAPSRPAGLKGEAKREWCRIVPELERLGLLTVIDRAALAGYCQAWARAVAAEKVLAEKGQVKETPNGYLQQRPEVSIAFKAWQLVRAFAAEFGLTPSARSRLSVQKPEDDPEDDLD
jgi:P27 family predicted phage terminase small subunit